MDKLSFWFQPQLLQGLQPLAYQEIARFNRKVCSTGLSRNSIIPPEGGTTNDMQFPVTRRVGFFVFKSTQIMSKNFHEMLEPIENPATQRDYTIEIVCPEFTSVCPKTGQPDYGELTFEYIPDKLMVELKSLKMYLQQFRNEGIFYENVTNSIFDDFVNVVQPKKAKLVARFTPRGGISSTITAEYSKDT